MKLGIVGLPNVGQVDPVQCDHATRARRARTIRSAPSTPTSAWLPCRTQRLKPLTDLYHAKKTTPAVVEFVDIAGLVRGASKGEGLGNKFLSHIREVDAIVHVVRCFDNDEYRTRGRLGRPGARHRNHQSGADFVRHRASGAPSGPHAQGGQGRQKAECGMLSSWRRLKSASGGGQDRAYVRGLRRGRGR